MAAAQPWKFTQLGGARKTITLTGALAPHGRPRKGPVVSDGFGLRHSATYYPGREKPTRHIFGVRHSDWQLKGRWMDRDLGKIGGAVDMLAEMKAFIADGETVLITWGNIGAWVGLVLEVLPERESASQIAYAITVAIDHDSRQALDVPTTPVQNPKDDTAKLLDLIGPLKTLSTDIPGDIEFQSSFLDSIDDFVSSVNAITGAIVDVVNGIDNFEQAASSELNRLRGGIGQLHTALVILNGTLDDASSDAAVERASASSQTEWARTREDDRAATLALLALLAEMDAGAEQVLRGRADKTSRAVAGDSWESLSRQHYGGSDKADALRQANGARYGAQPLAGKTLHVPKS
jgi:hypothetical protein